MGRTLHLIDIENLAADPYDKHGIALEQLRGHLALTWRRGDLVTVASNPTLWRRIAWQIDVPHRYIMAPRGFEGVGRSLLRSAAELDLSTFRALAIASGNGRFTDLAIEAGRLGARVTVVANEHMIARRLRMVAHRVGELPTPFDMSAAA